VDIDAIPDYVVAYSAEVAHRAVFLHTISAGKIQLSE